MSHLFVTVAKGGPTAFSNLGRLCYAHDRLKSGGWNSDPPTPKPANEDSERRPRARHDHRRSARKKPLGELFDRVAAASRPSAHEVLDAGFLPRVDIGRDRVETVLERE
jgi:hypothetical protein